MSDSFGSETAHRPSSPEKNATEPQQENTETKQKKASLISRRKFLRSALIGGTGLLLSSSRGLRQPSLPRHSPPMPEFEGVFSEETSASNETEKLNPQEQFERLGMAEFWPFYEQVSNVCEKFGATKDSYYFNRVFTVCDKVATGQITDEHDKQLQEIRDGWLEGRGQLQADAKAHIASLNIANNDTSGDPEIMRTTYLPRLATTFGPMVMAMPPNLYLTFTGATTGENLIATVSFAQYGEEEAWSQLYHELTHAADVWSERVQPYVDHRAFLEYATEYFIQAEQLLEEFYSSKSVEAARGYWNVGSIRAWGIEAAEVPIESLELLENNLFSQTFESEAFDYRVQRVVWTLHQDKKRGEQSSQTLPPDLSTHAEILQTAVLRATLHYLVNAPEYAFFKVQQAGMYDSSPEHARIAVHEKRMRTFASFPLNASKDLELQVREQLIIDL